MLSRKVSIVTGASGGMGLQVTKELAARGATVIACSRKLEAATNAIRDIQGDTVAAQLDIESPESIQRLASSVMSDHGRIDSLVNAAGYPFDNALWHKPFTDVSEDELKKVLNVDLLGTFRLTKAVIPHMVSNGRGVIVNFSSTPALSGYNQGSPYTVAKAGIIALTKHIALEYGASNIRAYALALGNIATDATFKSLSPEEQIAASTENAMKRWGQPSEIARAVASLVSDDFSFSTGSTIVLDGGAVLL